MTRRVLVVADAPGGPLPALYLPSLLEEFEVHVVWLDVESDPARARRLGALARVGDAGGSVVAVRDPRSVPEVLTDVVERTAASGIVAFSERVVHMAQGVAWEAGLPANPPDVLAALQDKRRQRSRLAAAGLITPRIRELPDLEAVTLAEEGFTFPAVLKPSVGMGSTATFRVEDPRDLRTAWVRARTLIREDARLAHHNPVMLLEEELRGDPAAASQGLGDYLSVEALAVDGSPVVLAVSDKLPLSRPYRENGHILPTLRSPESCERAVDVVVAAHRALGVRFGATHTEVKLTPRGPAVIEMNGRVGGSVPEQLLLAAGYDLPLNLARLSVGEAPETKPTFSAWSAYLTPQPPPGRHVVERCLGAEALASIPGVATVHHVTPPGAVVDADMGTASNVLRVVTRTDSPAAVFALARRLAGPETFRLRPLQELEEEASVSAPRDSIRVFIGEPSSIDPSNGFEHDGALILRFLADPLVDFDPATGEPKPAAAESWTVSEDGRQVEFYLRSTVRFHHGRAVDAADYVYSLSRLVRPETGSKLAYHLACVAGFDEVRKGRAQTLSGVTALSSHHLRVRLVHPFHEVVAVFGHRATAAVPAELAEGDPAGFSRHPISTGPYRIDEPWVEGRGLVLRRFDQYYASNRAFPDGGAGRLERLEFVVHDDVEDAYRAWHRGELDVVKVPPARIPEAMALGEQFRRTPCALMQYMGFPTHVKPFDDPVVRKAVAMAIDRRAIVDSAFSGTRPLAQRILPPALCGDEELDLTGVRFDPPAARALLDRYRIKPVTTDFAYNAGLGHDGWVEYLTSQLATELGWTVTPRPMEWREFLRWLGDADSLFRMTWAIDYPSVDNFLYPLFHSASIGDDNFTRYRNPEADRLIDDARACSDPVKRQHLYADAEALVCADLPLLPLWFGVQHHAVALDRFAVDGPPVDMFGEPVLRAYSARSVADDA